MNSWPLRALLQVAMGLPVLVWVILLVTLLLSACAAAPAITVERYHVAVKWGERIELRVHANKIMVVRKFK